MEMKKVSGMLMISMLFMGMVSETTACGKQCGSSSTPYNKPHSPPTPSSSSGGSGSGNGQCPVDALKLGVCVDVLGGLVHVGLGDPRVNKCCPLIKGLVELEVAACLCTTIRAKVLNLNLVVPVALTIFASCDITPPKGFTCPK